MSIFEPAAVRAVLRAAEPPGKRAEFDSKWEAAVTKRRTAWVSAQQKRVDRRQTQGQDATADEDDATTVLSEQQLSWMAEVLEYVNYVYLRTRVHGNSKSTHQPVLNDAIPLMGPRFLPPPPSLVHTRRSGAALSPESWYLRPLNVVHEFYYPSLRSCRVCGAGKAHTSSEGWASTIPRRVHGISIDELAIGQQLKCQRCRDRGSKQSSYALTSSAFWKPVSYDDIPADIPIFTKRCALTRPLFDLMTELRLGSTSSGFAETIRQLHLQQYLRDKREYVALLLAKLESGTLDAFVRQSRTPPAPFSEPYDKLGYALTHVSGDILSDVYLDFVRRTRRPESEMYLKSLTGVSLSIDSTFKITNKATVVQSGTSQRERLLRGGLLSGINENNEIVFWRFCQTQSNKEIEEALGGFETRRKLLDAPPVELCASDNCCKVRSAVVNQLPGAHATLDIFHIVQRYTDKLKATTFRASVARDIADALIKTRANARDNVLTEYWPKDEQERRLEAAWSKWSSYDIWKSGAAETHREQMGHVRKGCVARTRSDIATDGSRIEGSHKGWNSLNRTFTGGIEGLEAQGCDFVLRRNLRVAAKRKSASDFVASTYGSHHVALVMSIGADWNTIVHRAGSPNLSLAPVLRFADSNEQFGLVWAEYIALAPAIKREIAESFVIEVQEDVIELAAPGMLPAGMQEIAHDGGLYHSMQQPVIDLTTDEPTEDLATMDDAPTDGALPQSRRALGSSRLEHGTLQLAVAPLSPPPTDSARREETAIASVSCTSTRSGPPTTLQRSLLHSASASVPEAAPLPAAESHRCAPEHLNSALPSATGKRAAAAAADEPQRKRACKAGPTRALNERAPIAPIFRPQVVPATTMPRTESQHPSSSAAPVAAAAPALRAPALTRSAALFKAGTGVNPEALRITGKEWFLFANLRVSERLCTYDMTPARLGKVTVQFNEQLVAQIGETAVPKDPRAIMSTLAALETTVLARLNAGNFESQSGSETFWRNQCSFEITKRTPGKARKAHTCKRCLKLMYPFGTGDPRNHARDYCTDGANVSCKESVPYPQPPGVFVAGKRFNVPAFMDALGKLQNIVANELDKPLEYSRFQDMLGQRVQVMAGIAYFRCVKELVHEPAVTLLEEVDGVQMLRLGVVGDV